MVAPCAATAEVILVPDAGPLITLAYADSLDLLFKSAWSVEIVGMVLHELTRNKTSRKTKTLLTARKARFLTGVHSKVRTRSFLIFLEQKGRIPSAVDIERKAIQAGRSFSNLRFPP